MFLNDLFLENADDSFAAKTPLAFDITLWTEFHVAGEYDHGVNEISEDDPAFINAVNVIKEFLKKYNYEVWHVETTYIDGGTAQCSTNGFTEATIVNGLTQAINICKGFSALQKQVGVELICKPSLYLHATDHRDVEELASSVKEFTQFLRNPATLRQLAREVNQQFDANINENDDTFAAPTPGKYWNNTPAEYNQLWEKLIPASGACETLEGELLRSANRLYHDYFNNGFGNNVSGAENFLRNFGGGSKKLMQALNILHPYTRGDNSELNNSPRLEKQVEVALDAMMDVIFYQVLAANNNNDFHKSPGDLFDYQEKDDPYPSDDEDDEYEWERREDEYDYDADDDMYENADDQFSDTRIPPDAQQKIYEYGLELLHKLEAEGTRIMRDPKMVQYCQNAHDELDGGGTDTLFELVLDLTGATFNKAYVVDECLRESGYEGLIDFSWMITEGSFDDLYSAWDDFASDQSLRTDVHFKQSARKFFTDGAVNEASYQFDLDDEPEPPKKQQTKDKPKFNHDPFQQQQDRPLANRAAEPQGDAGGAEQPAAPRMRQATAAATRRAAGNVAPTDQMRDMLSRMRDIEIDPNLADYPGEDPTQELTTDVNTENLPAVAGQAIAAAGDTSPEFHQVARLPGNMSRMIRQLGKALFGSMTNTPTEEIYMIGNLGGQGPNTRMEVNAVANFVRENGRDMGPGDIDFDAVMPGYSAQTHQFEVAGIRWLLVKDFAGEYIYAWPEADSKTPGGQAQLGNEPKRLR